MPLSTFDARRSEAVVEGWTYPHVPKYHITDDLGTSIDPECVLTTTVWRLSALRYRIRFVVDEESTSKSYTVTEGILPRPNHKNSGACVWYVSPPDEDFQISFHVHSKTDATLMVDRKDDLSQMMVDQVSDHNAVKVADHNAVKVADHNAVKVSLSGAQHGSVRYRCIVGEVWVDMRLYARLSHRVRHLPWAMPAALQEIAYNEPPVTDET